MSRQNYLVRDPISFVGFPWRATANLVHGRVIAMLSLSPPCFLSLPQCGGIDIEQPKKKHPQKNFVY